MNQLAKMFSLQMQLQNKIGYNIFEKSQEYKNLMFIGIITEACEALEQTPWKPWKQSKELYLNNYQNEIIDLWSFVINLSLSANMTAEIVYKKYCEKHKINILRQKNGY